MPVKSEPRFRQIYVELKAEILGKHHSGRDMLPSENMLCKQFETSRQTIRSALKLLDQDGLVSNLPGKGWQIHSNGKKSPPQPKHIGHILFLGRADQATSLQYKGINEQAGALGLSTELIPINAISAGSRNSVDFEALNTKDCDGIIYFSDSEAPFELVQFARQENKPVVQLGHLGHYEFDTVCGDYQSALSLAVHTLYELGYRNIGFIGQGPLHTQKAVFKSRLLGFREACRELGIPDKHLLLEWDYFIKADADTNFLNWLGDCNEPTCIIGSAGNQFPQLTALLARHGMQVPTNVGIMLIGDPNIEETRNFFPTGRVSMLIEPWEELGKICAQRIYQRIQGDRSPASLSILPLPFYDGDSTPKPQ